MVQACHSCALAEVRSLSREALYFRVVRACASEMLIQCAVIIEDVNKADWGDAHSTARAVVGYMAQDAVGLANAKTTSEIATGATAWVRTADLPERDRTFLRENFNCKQVDGVMHKLSQCVSHAALRSTNQTRRFYVHLDAEARLEAERTQYAQAEAEMVTTRQNAVPVEPRKPCVTQGCPYAGGWEPPEGVPTATYPEGPKCCGSCTGVRIDGRPMQNSHGDSCHRQAWLGEPNVNTDAPGWFLITDASKLNEVLMSSYGTARLIERELAHRHAGVKLWWDVQEVPASGPTAAYWRARLEVTKDQGQGSWTVEMCSKNRSVAKIRAQLAWLHCYKLMLDAAACGSPCDYIDLWVTAAANLAKAVHRAELVQAWSGDEAEESGNSTDVPELETAETMVRQQQQQTLQQDQPGPGDVVCRGTPVNAGDLVRFVGPELIRKDLRLPDYDTTGIVVCVSPQEQLVEVTFTRSGRANVSLAHIRLVQANFTMPARMEHADAAARPRVSEDGAPAKVTCRCGHDLAACGACGQGWAQRADQQRQARDADRDSRALAQSSDQTAMVAPPPNPWGQWQPSTVVDPILSPVTNIWAPFTTAPRTVGVKAVRAMCAAARHEITRYAVPIQQTRPETKIVTVTLLRQTLLDHVRMSPDRLRAILNTYGDEELIEVFLAEVTPYDTARHNHVPRFARAVLNTQTMRPVDEASANAMQHLGEPCLVVRMKRER